MIRVNEHESSAVVTHHWSDVQHGKAELNLELEAPMSEAIFWLPGQRVRIEARWKPSRISFPQHEELLRILLSSSVQGAFLVQESTQVEEGRLAVTLASTGRLQPLE